ncbi:hypothetical protein SPAB_05343 [Salmonella enterica subsp. enterica serovar Paratyphi B str. SPB7]|uniref:Uncharacterized protein n=1 Tax=Salmonella paratyphi B (strain ATCC BAA-1250 / SPB7) TaxID=1016998 RepID=A0A6C6ZAD9_SALPB|nr:hypothetical protein SPAB_05343 [Salmonella enterica subsp. enterica serovar Paratyphi B str. SPB7]
MIHQPPVFTSILTEDAPERPNIYLEIAVHRQPTEHLLTAAHCAEQPLRPATNRGGNVLT